MFALFLILSDIPPQLITRFQIYFPGGSVSWAVGLPSSSCRPITNAMCVRARLVNFKRGAFDSQPQVMEFASCLPMVGGSPASSTTKAGRHDVAEVLLKVALKHQKINE